MAPLVCPECDSQKFTELDSVALRARWAGEEGRRWAWTSGLAYWRLCLRCHTDAWPGDPRALRKRRARCVDEAIGYSSSRPACCGGVVALTSGDFYLTHAPPECLRPPSLVGHPPVLGAQAASGDAARPLHDVEVRTGVPSTSSGSHGGASVPRRVAFAVERKVIAVPWLRREDRRPVPYGSEECDACGCSLGGRCWGPPHLCVVELMHEIAEVSVGTPPQRHSAICCNSCRGRRWNGESVALPSHEVEWAAAYFSQPARPTGGPG